MKCFVVIASCLVIMLALSESTEAHRGGGGGGFGRGGGGGGFGRGGYGGGYGRGYANYGYVGGYGAYNSYGYDSYYGYNPYSYYNYYYRRSADTQKAMTVLKCFFSDARNALMCSSPQGSVECETMGVYKKGTFNKFAIASLKHHNKYALYPEKQDQKGYMNTTVMHDNGEICAYSLYHQNTNAKLISDHGFNVKNMACFDRMMSLMTDLQSKAQILIESSSNNTSQNMQVDIIGEIVIV